MADLIAPSGTAVTVDDDLAKKLLAAGYKEKAKPAPKQTRKTASK